MVQNLAFSLSAIERVSSPAHNPKDYRDLPSGERGGGGGTPCAACSAFRFAYLLCLYLPCYNSKQGLCIVD